MNKKHELIIFCISFIYFIVLTSSIPFFWGDYININLVEKGFTYSALSYGEEFYFRPLENLTYFVMHSLFQENFFYYRILKSIVSSLAVMLVFTWIKYLTGNIKISYIFSLLFLFQSATINSAMYFYDFEFFSASFYLTAYLLFIQTYKKENICFYESFYKYFVVILLIYVSSLFKETGKASIIIIASFILVDNYKKIIRFFPLLFILYFLNKNPGFPLLLKDTKISAGVIFSQLFIDNSIYFKNISMYFAKISKYFSLLFVFLLFLIFYSRKNMKECFKFFVDGKKSNVIFLICWVFSYSLLSILVDFSEERYLVVPFIPLTVLLSVYVNKLLDFFKESNNKNTVVAIYSFLILLMFFFFLFSIKYSYSFGSSMIIGNQVNVFFDANYNDKTIYHDTNILANFVHFSKNKYGSLETLQRNITDEGIFIFPGSLDFFQNINTSLVKTFVKGPHCKSIFKTSLNESYSQQYDVFYSETKISTSSPIKRCVILTNLSGNIKKKLSVTINGEEREYKLPIIRNNVCYFDCNALTHDKTKLSIKINNSPKNSKVQLLLGF